MQYLDKAKADSINKELIEKTSAVITVDIDKGVLSSIDRDNVFTYTPDIAENTVQLNPSETYDKDAAYIRQASKWVPLSSLTESSVIKVTSFSSNNIYLDTELVPVMLQSASGKYYTIDSDDFQFSGGSTLIIDIGSALCLWNMSEPGDYMYVYLMGNTVVK